MKYKISELTQGITIIHLYGKDLRTLRITLPPIDEQSAIANILKEIDTEIEVLQYKLTKYRMIKQGMMQVLLTGKKRLS
jgi:type I restriction enzyme S subunit